jgi:hypothetical protein
LDATKKNIENIKAYIHMQMSKNSDLTWTMNEELRNVEKFYSGDKLITYLKENT